MSYLNVIGQWGSMAQKGRSRAKNDEKNEIQILQNQYKQQELQRQKESAMQQETELTVGQAEHLSKFYRDEDKEELEEIAKTSQINLQKILENYGDDYGKVRAGIEEYQNAVINSDKAKIIKANIPQLTNYLQQMKEDASKVSAKTRDRFELWKNNKIDAFSFDAYHDENLDTNSDEYKQALQAYTGDFYAREKAALEVGNNRTIALFNYNVDTYDNPKDYRYQVEEGDLINYLNASHFKDKKVSLNEQKILTGYDPKEKKVSKNLMQIMSKFNQHYTGEWGDQIEGYLGSDVDNNNAYENLLLYTNAGATNKIPGKNAFSWELFNGYEHALTSALFEMGDGKKDLKKEFDSDELMSIASRRDFVVYDENGVVVTDLTRNRGGSRGQIPGGNFLRARDYSVDSFNMGFEVEVDGEKRLLTWEDINEQDPNDPESSKLYKNKTKTPVMYLAVRDSERFGLGDDASFRPSKNDRYVYIKVDLQSAPVARALDKTIGDLTANMKNKSQTSPNTFNYQGVNNNFVWTVSNVDNAIKDPEILNSLETIKQNHGIASGPSVATMESMLLALSLQESFSMHPIKILNQFETNSQAFPGLTEMLNELADGNTEVFYDYFKNIKDDNGNPLLQKYEETALRKNYKKIIQGYAMINDQFEKTGQRDKEGKDIYSLDPMY